MLDSFGAAWGMDIVRVEFLCISREDGLVSSNACASQDAAQFGLFASGGSLGFAVAGASLCALTCICGWLRALRRELSNNKLEIEKEMAVCCACFIFPVNSIC